MVKYLALRAHADIDAEEIGGRRAAGQGVRSPL